MRRIKQYPFLTAFFAIMILGFLIGVIKAALYPQDVSLGRYFAWHLTQPFWTELLPDYSVEGRSSLGYVDTYSSDLTGDLREDEEKDGNDMEGAGTDPTGIDGAVVSNVSGTSAAADGDASGAGESSAETAGEGTGVSGEDNGRDAGEGNTGATGDLADAEAVAAGSADGSGPASVGDNATHSGVTGFVTYEPVETDSYYYTDRGRIALTTDYAYDTVDDSYFADAAFIGDSRTLGLHDYSGWKESAAFYCENGFSIYRWTKGGKVTFQNTGRDVDLTGELQRKKYGKIYIMAGMNDLGYGNTELFGEWFGSFLEMVKESQPDAVIYLMANLHISRKQDGVKEEMNNVNVNDKNATIATFADGQRVFYLDANPLFCDEAGYLKDDITFDGFHLYAANYPVWTDFIKSHAVER
ncbi:MAG: hypothetical protein K5682_05090 [Lachnospiraceae bacterium]|nr:hypothetical protein [Lachnospiraceae bacterium]